MRIALVGDVMLGRLVNQKLKHSLPVFPWGNTLPLLQDTDLRICNLECVISDIGRPWSTTPKVFHFRSDEKNIASLQAGSMDIVSLANNHVLDYEYEALQRMLSLLDAHQIVHAGAGRNLEEAARPALCQVKGQKIGFLAFTDNEEDWEAQQDKPGIFYVPTKLNDNRAQDLFKHIHNLRMDSDFIIISAHWGPNWGYNPPQEHVSFAHALIDAGADLIYGHSGHIFRGVEIYKNRPILYCAGDFIDDYAVDEVERNDESFIFVLEIEPKYVRLYLYPTTIHNFQANLATGEWGKQILLKMRMLSKELGTAMECLDGYAKIEVQS